MTKTRWIAGAALAATLSLSALAQAAPDQERPAPPKTRAELQAKIAEHFKKVDANGDGFVTAAERDAAREAMKAKWQERRAERRAEHFARLDADRNGALSKEEFLAPRERGEAKGGHRGHHGFGHMKGHRGGGHWAGGQGFERADANKDGKLSLAEAQAGPLARFDRIDANKDGTISAEEHKAARDAMRAKWQERRAGKEG